MGDVLSEEITQHTLLRIIKIEPHKTKRYPRQTLNLSGFCYHIDLSVSSLQKTSKFSFCFSIWYAFKGTLNLLDFPSINLIFTIYCFGKRLFRILTFFISKGTFIVYDTSVPENVKTAPSKLLSDKPQ